MGVELLQRHGADGIAVAAVVAALVGSGDGGYGSEGEAADECASKRDFSIVEQI